MNANTAKQISVQQTNSDVFVRFSSNRSFSTIGNAKTIWMPETAEYTDLLTGRTAEVTTVDLPGWGFFWMKSKL